MEDHAESDFQSRLLSWLLAWLVTHSNTLRNITGTLKKMIKTLKKIDPEILADNGVAKPSFGVAVAVHRSGAEAGIRRTILGGVAVDVYSLDFAFGKDRSPLSGNGQPPAPLTVVGPLIAGGLGAPPSGRKVPLRSTRAAQHEYAP